MGESVTVEEIGLDVPIQEVYPSVVERYFTPRYILNVFSKGDDVCILFHSNRVCLVTLAPSHPILAEKKTISEIDYSAKESDEEQMHKNRRHRNQSTNRLKNKVRGKKKKGAQILHKQSLLCKVTCSDGSAYLIRSGIPGKLVEINEKLIETPNLLVEKPSSEGYIAILLPKTVESDKLRDKLMTKEQYEKALEEQESKGEAEAEEASTKTETDQDSSDEGEQNGGEATSVKTQMEEDAEQSGGDLISEPTPMEENE